MTTQHTPGPWHIGSETVAEEFIENTEQGWPYFVHRNHKGLGDVGYYPAIGIQSLSDARLIAAAPELLTALEAFLRAPSIGSDGPGSLTIVVQEFNLKSARAAIAKAEGSN